MDTNRRVQVNGIILVFALLAIAAIPRPVAPPNRQIVTQAERQSLADLSPAEQATLRDLMRQAEYQFTWQFGDGVRAYRAPNRAQDLALSLATDGLHASRSDPQGQVLWDLRLSLAAYGEETFPSAIDRAALFGSRQRVDYRWSEAVLERYVNNSTGLSQQFRLARPPIGSESDIVELTLALGGSLSAQVGQDGRVVRLYDAAGRSVLSYDLLSVQDAAGKSLPAHMRLASCCALQLVIDTQNTAYPLTLDLLLYSQVVKLTASDAQDDDYFGFPVAIDGDTLIVGAEGEDGAGTDRGAAYVFARNQGGADGWGQAAKLTASDAQDTDLFGISVAISGDTAVVGSPSEDGAGTDRGAAYVFARNQGGADGWGQVTKLTASDAQDYDHFGYDVTISGDTIVVGAEDESGTGIDRGAAYVFSRNQGGADHWGQVTKLTASDAQSYDFFGCAVAISGDTLIIGAYGEDGAGNWRGAAYVFTRNWGGADHWGQAAKLTASDAQDGDSFGYDVTVSGDIAVVGARGEDGAGTNRGAAYVFARNQGGADHWGQAAKLTASDAQDDDFFGNAVAISGDTLIVGAPYEGSASQGAAYVFARNEGGADHWGQTTRLTASDAQDGDLFGNAVAISGDTVVVGAYGEDGAGSDRGAAYIFAGGGQWQQLAVSRAADAANSDWLGWSTAASGDTLVVGAPMEDGAGSNRGAAYVFTRNRGGADGWSQVDKLVAATPHDNDRLGISVAISGDTVVVGADWENGAGADYGAAYVFSRNWGGADNWGQVTRLTASDAQDYDYFGYAVAISGDTAVVGAYGEDGAGSDRGSAYVFARNVGGADHWGQVYKLTAADTQDDDYFGRSVAISGDTAIVGAYGEDGAGSDRGAAYIFARNVGGADRWGQVTKLGAGLAQNYMYFGFSVAISGDTAIVGDYGEDGAGSDRGAAYVFTRNKGGADHWGKVARLFAVDAQDDDFLGYAVAISGDAVVVGAYGEDGAGLNRGAAYVFARNVGGADHWGQSAKLTAADPANGDFFGYAVAISDDLLVAGAPYQDGAGSDRGAAYVFILRSVEVYLPLVMRQ